MVIGLPAGDASVALVTRFSKACSICVRSTLDTGGDFSGNSKTSLCFSQTDESMDSYCKTASFKSSACLSIFCFPAYANICLLRLAAFSAELMMLLMRAILNSPSEFSFFICSTSAFPSTPTRILLKSCATLPAINPRLSIRCARLSRCVRSAHCCLL